MPTNQTNLKQLKTTESWWILLGFILRKSHETKWRDVCEPMEAAEYSTGAGSGKGSAASLGRWKCCEYRFGIVWDSLGMFGYCCTYKISIDVYHGLMSHNESNLFESNTDKIWLNARYFWIDRWWLMHLFRWIWIKWQVLSPTTWM